MQLTTTLQNIEDEQEAWPDELLDITWVAIGKADSGGLAAPLKFRLIAVGSHVYRTWAALRAAQVAEAWLPAVACPGAYGGLRKRGPIGAAALDNQTWDWAERNEVELHSLYVDCSRCFDTLRYSDMAKLAHKMGMGRRLLSPILRWWRAHKRFLVVENWQQQGICPQRGIPQGCPLSVAFCVLWGSSWSTSVRRLLAEHQVMIGITLTYLDDLTVLSSNYQALVAAYGLTGRFFQCWQVQLNPSKTAYLVNPRAKQHQRQIEGLLQHDSQKLLGCMTGWKPTTDLLSGRVATAMHAARRLTMLPVSPATLC